MGTPAEARIHQAKMVLSETARRQLGIAGTDRENIVSEWVEPPDYSTGITQFRVKPTRPLHKSLMGLLPTQVACPS